MEFLNNLVETTDSFTAVSIMRIDKEHVYRGFNHIEFDDVSLSVQASYGHYCTPRRTLKDLNEYTTMEFALIRNNDFTTVREVLPSFSALEEIETYEDTVYGFVPVELIEKLYQEFKAKK